MLLWRAALGVSVWRAAFWHVGSASRHTMIGGMLAVVKGGFSRVRISPVIPTTHPRHPRTLALPSTPPRFPPTRE